MKTFFSKRKQILTVLALYAISFFNLSHAQDSNVQDLVFVANFDSYDIWYNKAFKPDTERRSQYCEENKTAVGKINNEGAIITLKAFNMSRMPEFVADANMAKLMKANNITHDEVYRTLPLNEKVKSGTKTIHLLFRIKMIDYDLWYNNAFVPDAERRKAFCNEAKTKVAKVSDKEAMVILYDFEVDKLWDLGNDKDVEQLMKKYQVEHQVSILEAI